jgi:hypothetical protein
MLESIAQRVGSLEERLNASDSLYRLAAQTNRVREKDRRERQQRLSKTTKDLEQRVDRVEQKVTHIPKLIKEAVRNEIRQCDKSDQILVRLDQSRSEMANRIAALETTLAESNHITQKYIKKLKVELELVKTQPEEDSRAEELGLQVSEIRRRQRVMLELIHTMRLHKDQNFDQANSQLSGIWDRLSMK